MTFFAGAVLGFTIGFFAAALMRTSSARDAAWETERRRAAHTVPQQTAAR